MANGHTYIIATLHTGIPSWSYHYSIRRLLHYDLTSNQRLRGFSDHECGAGRIIDGRNDAVRTFLDTDVEWLIFIDSDMGFEPDAVDRLIDAGGATRGVIGGLCFGNRRVGKGPHSTVELEQFPTIYQWVETSTTAGFAPVYDYPEDSLIQCDGTGAAFLAIHRQVLERMGEKYSDTSRPWFFEAEHLGRFFGEDLSFFMRCTEMGIPVHVHTGAKTSHYKNSYLTDLSQPKLDDVPNYVVIPQKGNTHLTRALIDDLRQDNEADHIFIVDNGTKPLELKDFTSEMSGWPDLVTVLHQPEPNIHKSWNLGIYACLERSHKCNIAILNNDIELTGSRFLTKLAYPIRHDPVVGVSCPNYDGREGEGYQALEDVCAGRYDGTGGLSGFAFMLKGESGYLFPEELHWWYGDNDLLLTLSNAGGKAVMVLDAFCEHIAGGSQTAEWEDPEMKAILEKDRAEFLKRYRERWSGNGG